MTCAAFSTAITDMVPLVVGVVLVAVIAVSVINAFGNTHAGYHPSKNTSRDSLQRNSDYVTVLSEDADSGYGLAAHELADDSCIELQQFNADDEVYMHISIYDSEWADVADFLSEKACEQERDINDD